MLQSRKQMENPRLLDRSFARRYKCAGAGSRDGQMVKQENAMRTRTHSFFNVNRDDDR